MEETFYGEIGIIITMLRERAGGVFTVGQAMTVIGGTRTSIP